LVQGLPASPLLQTHGRRLEEADAEFAREFGVEYRIVVADHSQDRFLKKILSVIDPLDVVLVISNAGTGSPGKFLTNDHDEMVKLLRLNTLSLT
jgi:short-subunit dehydrogenase